MRRIGKGGDQTTPYLALIRSCRDAGENFSQSSHNPRIYKDRIVGDYAVNGTPPPYQWGIGRSPA
ncbi:MAG: hypothetical protein EOS70_32060 [Mesorhizobium sp.]|nr:MAG: hypothetical protein EOS70_32060 [Mesorhizobium sp.]